MVLRRSFGDFIAYLFPGEKTLRKRFDGNY